MPARNTATEALASARTAQRAWSTRPVRERAKIIGRLRGALTDHCEKLAAIMAASTSRPASEKIVSEILPLIEASRWLHRNAEGILRPRHEGRRGRPRWLGGVSLEISRRPFGVILVVAPGNYPLFLPGVHALHALAAGNAVLIKPAPECLAPIAKFREIAVAVGIEGNLMQILPEKISSAIDAVHAGVDKVIFTGSSENGRDLLQHLAVQNTPSVAELSGTDNVFVREDADLDRAAGAIAFAVNLNAGNTCIAPQAIYAHTAIAHELRDRLHHLGVQTPIITVVSDDDAVELATTDEHGLGASVFSGDEDAARRLAARIPTGFATINDIIVPTSDPRFPFGGVRGSGFGSTRGREGLLEMTFPHVTAFSRAKRLRHTEPLPAHAAELFLGMVSFLHAEKWRKRLKGLLSVIKAARDRSGKTRS